MTASKKLIQAAAGSAGGAVPFYDYEIDNSCRFDGSSYLDASVTTSNRRTWTFSAWVKFSTQSTYKYLFDSGNASNNYTSIRTDSSTNRLTIEHYGGPGVNYYIVTTAVHRDPSAWYHIVAIFDTTNATASERMRLYVNGERITSFDNTSYPPQNFDGFINSSTYGHRVGGYDNYSSYHMNGYMAEIHFCDGNTYDPSYFGETKNGVWIPKSPSVTYGTNGFYLDFGNSSALGTDSSGNGNNFTSSGLTSSDQMIDTPTNNFCTYNPIDTDRANLTFSEGNIKIVKAAASDSPKATTTMGVTSGKWYWETAWSSFGASGNWYLVMEVTTREQWAVSNAYNTVQYFASSDGSINGYKRINTNGSYVTSAYGSGFSTSGDIVGVALDLDSGTVTFYKNGVSQGAISLPSTTEAWFPAWTTDGTSNYATHITNFGQDGSFAGTKTAQGNTDANGFGDFYYSPPSGHLALCTANLPEPTIGPNSTTTSGEHFNTVLWTGDGNSSRAITGVGFQPAWVWIKNRSAAQNHVLHDAVRGAGKYIMSDNTNAEATNTNQLSSFDSDGFTVGTAISTNQSGGTFVAWNWKGNGSGVSNTDGSITSTVSANTDAGISIVKYTGNNTSGATIGHGLGVAPKVIIQKGNAALNWPVWFYDISNGTNSFIQLNLTNGTVTDSTFFTSTAPTSTVFSVGNSTHTNSSSYFSIAYCFAEVEGFSKFGSYTGNGSADGPFVYTGFRPAWIMAKRTDVANAWWMIDSTRSPYNPETYKYLYANYSDAENTTTSYDRGDILSNGFKLRKGGTGWLDQNASGGTYIYMAFAEMPFKYSVGR